MTPTGGVETAPPALSTAAVVDAPVLAAEPVGAYTRLVLDAPAAAAAARPGQFAACSTGDSGMLLRRSFSIAAVDAGAGTVTLVVAAAGPGTARIAALRPGERLSVVAPLGQPFSLPPEGEGVVLVGGGYGAAPLAWLGRALRARGSAVDLVVGAGDARRLLAHDVPTAASGDADAPVDRLHVTTDDGSAGQRGRVTDALAPVLAEHGARHVLACGPMVMLRAVHEVAARGGAATQLATEESMACGVGVCMTCVLPVVGADGATRMLRACTEGPVFDGRALRWDAIGAAAPGRPAGVGAQVPADAVGAPRAAPSPPPGGGDAVTTPVAGAR
ncbi:iron-sulfur cluster-binding protein [Pseudokineococcus sp. 1T1Z-3]|uniref:iron-sulfur cluster-binding protein n=1 Tax=Pseudokineococcus sp. 1T1Z-3 TaxID=3132745 RepID=UPI00309D5EB8